MSGRHAQPLELLLSNSKSRLTAEEIRRRLEFESNMRLGNHDFKIPDIVKKNKVAKRKWKEIIELYTKRKLDFVTSADTGILERYCIAYSEYINLQFVRSEIERKDAVKTYHATDELNLENSINKKMEILTKLEDRLFLNPLSKIKNIPQKHMEEKPEESEKEMFG